MKTFGTRGQDAYNILLEDISSQLYDCTLNYGFHTASRLFSDSEKILLQATVELLVDSERIMNLLRVGEICGDIHIEDPREDGIKLW